jgi:WD40 repeat protein
MSASLCPRLLGLLFAAILISGCQSFGGRPADLVLETGSSAGNVLAVDPSSSLVAVGTLDGSVRVWSLARGTRHGAWRAHRGTVNGILFPARDRLLTVGYDGEMALWSAAGRRIAGWSVEAPATAFGAARMAGIVATGHADGKVRLWDLKGRKRGQWAPHNGAVRTVAITPDGRRIASSGTDGQVRIWSPGEQPRPLQSPLTDPRTLAFSRAGDALLGAGWFNLYRWELPAGTLRRLATEHLGIINSLYVLPDERIATISRQTDSSVLILNAASGATLQRVGRHDLCGRAVTVAPDGRVLVSTGDDATVRVWRLGEPSFSRKGAFPPIEDNP